MIILWINSQKCKQNNNASNAIKSTLLKSFNQYETEQY